MTYMFVAEGVVTQVMNKPLLRVFKMTDRKFVEVQQIKVDFEVKHITHFIQFERELLVFTLLHDSTVHIYKLRGASGFVLFDTIRGRGADKLDVFSDEITAFNPKSYYVALGHTSGQTFTDILSSDVWDTTRVN